MCGSSPPGSVAAQLAFFRHTEAGDLLPFFRGHYDTTIGPKREPDSYRRIAADMKLPPERILFLSDIIAELDAARAAGLHTGVAMRPGNAAVAEGRGHERIRSFEEIHAAGSNPAGHPSQPSSHFQEALGWATPEVLRRAWRSLSRGLPRPSEYLRACHPKVARLLLRNSLVHPAAVASGSRPVNSRKAA